MAHDQYRLEISKRELNQFLIALRTRLSRLSTARVSRLTTVGGTSPIDHWLRTAPYLFMGAYCEMAGLDRPSKMDKLKALLATHTDGIAHFLNTNFTLQLVDDAESEHRKYAEQLAGRFPAFRIHNPPGTEEECLKLCMQELVRPFLKDTGGELSMVANEINSKLASLEGQKGIQEMVLHVGTEEFIAFTANEKVSFEVLKDGPNGALICCQPASDGTYKAIRNF